MSWIKNNEWLSPDVDHRVRWSEIGRFLANYRPFRTRLALTGLLVLIGSFPAFLIPVIFWKLQTALLFRDARLLALGLLGFLAISLIEVLTTCLVRIIRSRISTLLNRELVLQYYRKVLNLSVEDFIAFRQRTNLFQRVIDAMSITPQFTDVLVRGGQSAIVVVVVAAVIATLSPIVFGVLLVGAALLFAYVLLQAQQLRVLRQRALALNYPLVGKMTEIINGLLTIKALAASVRVTSDISQLVDGKTDADYREAVQDVRASQVAQAIRTVTLVFAVGASCVLMMDGVLTFADLVSLFVLANLFLQPVTDLAMLYQLLSRLSVNVANYYEVLDLQDEAEETRVAVASRGALAAGAQARPFENVRAPAAREVRVLSLVGGESGSGPEEAGVLGRAGMEDYTRSAGDGGGQPGSRGLGHIVFQDLEFAYRGGPTILSGVNLEIFPGERISLIGRSGVGKTTLFRLLLGFLQPRSGTILVDGTDVSALVDKNAYRQQFGVVSQQDALFGVSIRENLMFGLEAAIPDERIEQALRMVNLWEDIQRMSDGLETMYSAEALSGGQKQRFFIARALLRRPNIVLLDEPTSALDFQNEGLVVDAINRLVGGKTTLTIAHRLSTVRNSDRVVVLDEGTIRATGTHDELYQLDDYYRALCEYNSFMV
ncbi:MAG TPA: ABC transporter ATP-binding protein [Longimicrobiaceae bacterium]|nr:ABC transporter ATP-binding protein [Longimicrobiaceae bacterium]